MSDLLFGNIAYLYQRNGEFAVSQDVLDDVLEGEIHLGDMLLDEFQGHRGSS